MRCRPGRAVYGDANGPDCPRGFRPQWAVERNVRDELFERKDMRRRRRTRKGRVEPLRIVVVVADTGLGLRRLVGLEVAVENVGMKTVVRLGDVQVPGRQQRQAEHTQGGDARDAPSHEAIPDHVGIISGGELDSQAGCVDRCSTMRPSRISRIRSANAVASSRS